LGSSKIELKWPLAKERRRHIHGMIDSMGLPVTHVTLRRGRPHTLVLTKTKDLFRREAELRRAYEQSLARVEAHLVCPGTSRGRRVRKTRT
jgi:hypothetical protein